VLVVVVCESVWLFAVDGVITDLHLLLAHAQGNAAHVLDEAHDERCPHNVPADDEESAHDLETNLSWVALNRSTGVGGTESCATFNGSEDTSANATDNSTDKMCVEDLESVINVGEERQSAAGDVHGEPWDDTGAETETNGSPASNEACSRSDGNETSDHALNSANN